jgi:hypothetical protein
MVTGLGLRGAVPLDFLQGGPFHAVTAVTRQGGHVAVLVVVSDGWPEPAAATSRFQLLEPHAGALIRVPFIPGPGQSRWSPEFFRWPSIYAHYIAHFRVFAYCQVLR